MAYFAHGATCINCKYGKDLGHGDGVRCQLHGKDFYYHIICSKFTREPIDLDLPEDEEE